MTHTAARRPGAALYCSKLVLVAQGRERASQHFVDESDGPVELDDASGKALTETEMHGLERNLIAEDQTPLGNAGDRALLRKGRSRAMRADISSEVEDKIDGRRDLSLDGQ